MPTKIEKELKKLILIRHAERNYEDPSEDTGLTPKGKNQAEKIRDFYLQKFPELNDDSPLIMSSPKLRCIQTLAPLGLSLGREVLIEPMLNEAQTDEDFNLFLRRVEEFFEWWIKKGPKICISCTHGDWIPFALKNVLNHEELSVKKGSWTEIEIEDGKPIFKVLHQKV